MNKTSLSDFFQTLEQLKDQQYNLYITGLLISDDKEIIKKCPHDFSLIDIEEKTTKEDFFNYLKKAFLDKKWVCFDIKTNKVPSFVEEQFLRIKRSNETFFQENEGRTFFNEKQDENMRFFGIINKDDYNSLNINPSNNFTIFYQN
ncbi:MAG: hypothetical protein WC446_03635 [Candidatus Paceibacterota bacterium]|jgi:hypothetical protein